MDFGLVFRLGRFALYSNRVTPSNSRWAWQLFQDNCIHAIRIPFGTFHFSLNWAKRKAQPASGTLSMRNWIWR